MSTIRLWHMVLVTLVPAIPVRTNGAEMYDYFVSQPDMRWAYQLETCATSCVVRVTLPGYEAKTSNEGVLLAVSGVTAWTQPGQPRLPVLPVVFRLDDDVSYQVAINPGETEETSIGYLLPEISYRAESISDEASRSVKEHRPDGAIYEQDALWPEKLFTVDVAKGGGQRYLRLGVMPFQYNPKTETLRFYRDLTMTITFSKVATQ